MEDPPLDAPTNPYRCRARRKSRPRPVGRRSLSTAHRRAWESARRRGPRPKQVHAGPAEWPPIARR